MLHAAGLATDEGRVVVLVGPSGRGKTTASRVLGRDFGYVSDESVGIEADGTVLPYRKPLSIIEDHDHLKAQRSPKELGLRPLPDRPLRVAALVLIERDPGVAEPRVERLDPAEGIVGLAEQASYLGRLPHPLRTLWSHVAAVGGVHRVTYSDAATLAPAIAQLAGREPSRVAGQGESEPPAAPRTSPGCTGDDIRSPRTARHRPTVECRCSTRWPSTTTGSRSSSNTAGRRRESSCSTASHRRSGRQPRNRRRSPPSRRPRSRDMENRRERMLRPWSRHPSPSWSQKGSSSPTRRDSACRPNQNAGPPRWPRWTRIPRSARLSAERQRREASLLRRR